MEWLRDGVVEGLMNQLRMGVRSDCLSGVSIGRIGSWKNIFKLTEVL